MRAQVMSAGWFSVAGETRTKPREKTLSKRKDPGAIAAWSPESFAHEQIRRLVSQIFRSGTHNPTRQIVFSAVEPETDIGAISLRVGFALALETQFDVLVVGGRSSGEIESGMSDVSFQPSAGNHNDLREVATRVRRNLWLLPRWNESSEACKGKSIQAYLSEIRLQFEYSIVQAPCAGQSSEASEVGQLADGIVLVVSAQRTRRAAARKVKQGLEEAQVRLLGAVLSDREFPIPEGIYRRL